MYSAINLLNRGKYPMITKIKEKLFLSVYSGFLAADLLGFYMQSSIVVAAGCTGLVTLIVGSFFYHQKK
jgi:hypothetical protein